MFINFYCHYIFQILVYFVCKNCNPWKRSSPLSQQPHSKNWDPIKPPSQQKGRERVHPMIFLWFSNHVLEVFLNSYRHQELLFDTIKYIYSNSQCPVSPTYQIWCYLSTCSQSSIYLYSAFILSIFLLLPPADVNTNNSTCEFHLGSLQLPRQIMYFCICLNNIFVKYVYLFKNVIKLFP